MNRVTHFEIHAENPEKIADFYRNMFGWDIKKWDNDQGVDYWLIMTGPEKEPGGINGGLVKRQGPLPKGGEPMTAYVCTIDVPSLDEYIMKLEKEGGKLAMPKSTIPGVGYLAYCSDPEGNIFGMIQNTREPM